MESVKPKVLHPEVNSCGVAKEIPMLPESTGFFNSPTISKIVPSRYTLLGELPVFVFSVQKMVELFGKMNLKKH